MAKPKKQKPTNCTYITDCIKSENCTKQIISENYIEAMVLKPDCFESRIVIKIEKPKFLKNK